MTTKWFCLGANTFLTYSSFEQPPPSEEYRSEVALTESIFDTPSREPARRDHIMEVLKDLRGIYIRASYWTKGDTAKLMDITLDEGVSRAVYRERFPQDRSPVPLPSVEQCSCELSYQGRTRG